MMVLNLIVQVLTNGDPQTNDNENEEDHQSKNENPQNNDASPPPPPMTRPHRERRKAISDNYTKWQVAMEDELKSMGSNDVWDLVENSTGAKRVGYKWVYKIKYDSKGNVERFKARLMGKGLTQSEGINYN
jgi:hypothetical protein